jgi:hypothetical protein
MVCGLAVRHLTILIHASASRRQQWIRFGWFRPFKRRRLNAIGMRLRRHVVTRMHGLRSGRAAFDDSDPRHGVTS